MLRLKKGNIYNLNKKARSEYMGLKQVVYIKEIDETYSLVANISNNPQILLGYLTYKYGTSKIYIDCRALYKVHTKYINVTSEIELHNTQQVIKEIYDLHDKVKRTKYDLIESNKGIKHRIEILNLNNGSTEELERKYNYQQKMIHQLHVNPQKMMNKYKSEPKHKVDHTNYYTKFKEVPSVYVKFYRG